MALESCGGGRDVRWQCQWWCIDVVWVQAVEFKSTKNENKNEAENDQFVQAMEGFNFSKMKFKMRSKWAKNGYNRVVHGSHFPIIFHFIFIPFFVRLKLRMNKKMYLKWNPNLAFAKSEWKMIIFHLLAVGLVRKICFCFIFLNFTSQGVHSNYFSHHFSFPFVCSLAKYMKMTQKWNWKWAENGYCEQP